MLKQKNSETVANALQPLILHCVIVLPEMSLKLIFVAWPIVCSCETCQALATMQFAQFGKCFSCIVCIVHTSVWVVLIAFVSVSSSLSGVWVCGETRPNTRTVNSLTLNNTNNNTSPKTMHLSRASLPRWTKMKRGRNLLCAWRTKVEASDRATKQKSETTMKTRSAHRRRWMQCGVLFALYFILRCNCWRLFRINVAFLLLRVKYSACENRMNASTVQTTRHQNRLKHFFIRHWVMCGAS